MPFTPFHAGPCACIGLPLNRYIDIPVLILSNIAIDIEPLAVMLFNLDYPLHGYCHTLLVGIVLGIIWGLLMYPARGFLGWCMKLFRLPYKTSINKMIISAVAGIWLHIVFDSVLYKEINPFWPFLGNPLFYIVRFSTIFYICEISLIIALVVYPARAFSIYRKEKSLQQ